MKTSYPYPANLCPQTLCQQATLICLLLGLTWGVCAQTSPRVALNKQIRYIQTSNQQVMQMAESIRDLYPKVLKASEGNSRERIMYRCPYNDEPYYREQAQTKSGPQGQQLLTASGNFQTALEAIVQQCQALDTYFKLETYKTDQYAGALSLLQGMPALLAGFTQQKQAYEAAIAKANLAKTAAGPYNVAAEQLRRIMALHRETMTGLQYNANEPVHAGWPQREMLAHISRIADALDEVARNKPKLNYPASAYYQSCLACANDFLESRREYVDAYTVQAQQTDEHANDYYNQCLNTYNNCLVSFYNQFTDAAASDGYTAIHMAPLSPVLTIQHTAVPPDKSIRVFAETTVPPLNLLTQTKPIDAGTADALNRYVAFINECARKNNYLLMTLRNNGILYQPFPAKNALYYSFETYTLPKSLLAEVERQSRHLPEAYRPSLRLQAQQLMDIAEEMEGLRQWLVDFSKEKRWEKEGFATAERTRDRFVLLFDWFDQKKEQLYADIVRIYNSYPASNVSGSWSHSYEALSGVMQADKTLCTRVQHGAMSDLPHEPVEQAAVKAITDEFANMKGIEKLGRYNGLCPYTPYEDIGLNSRRLAEYARAPERKKPTDFIYLYNVIVEDYNRFVDLSGQPFLKNTRLMDASNPEPPPAAQAHSSAPPKPRETAPPKPVLQPATTLRDTVYIRDTIYLEKPPAVGASFYSLEGFPDNNLVFLLDVSGSMKAENRLTLLQSSISRLVRLLRDQDDISVLSFSGKGKVLLPPTSGRKKDQILNTISGLKPEGTTNIEEGLKMAFQTARQNFKRQGNNRIILATDGDFILSETALAQIREHAEIGITLSVFKFGSKPGKNLKAISDNGGGNLISITPENAEIFMIKEAQK